MLNELIRNLAFGCLLLMTACATSKPGSYLVLNFGDADLSVFAVEIGNFGGVKFEGDQPGEFTGKSAFIRGVGSVGVGKNHIQFDRSKVYVNGKSVGSGGMGHSNYILYPDGRLEDGFIRSFK